MRLLGFTITRNKTFNGRYAPIAADYRGGALHIAMMLDGYAPPENVRPAIAAMVGTRLDEWAVEDAARK